MSFEGKVVIISGGSSGIGAGVALHLAKLGAKVSIVGRNQQRLNEVAERMRSSGAKTPLIVVADVTKDAERIVNETIDFGKLDVLINNAGTTHRDSVMSTNLFEFDLLIDTNIRSVINLTKLCIPHLEKTKGNVVNVSSINGLKPSRNSMSYCISKAALDQFTKCSALDLAPKGIRVNSINPAIIRTNIFEALRLSTDEFEQMLNNYRYPVGRIGDVPDTSAAIAFLADNETASFLTGILLPVDGGAMVAGASCKVQTDEMKNQ